MVRLRFTLHLTAVAAVALLSLAGCPRGATSIPEEIDASAESDAALQVLGETVTTADLSKAQFSPEVQSVDVAAETGDVTATPTTVADVPFESIELDPTAVFEDARVEVGELIRAHGGLAGRFVTDRPDGTSDEVGGEFNGRWFSANGEIRGRVHGEFRHQPAGELPPGLAGGGVFHGRYINADGQFAGFIRGRYGHLLEGRGFFFGYWFDRNDRLLGVLKGHWDDEDTGGGGVFLGRWAAFNICDEAASLPETSFELLTPDEVDAVEGLTLTQAALDVAAVVDVDEAEDVEVLQEPNVNYDAEGPCIDPDAPYGFLRGWHRALPPQDPNNPSDPNDPGDPNAPQTPHGVMHARWFSVNAAISGHLLGRWVALGVEPGEGAQVLGHFHARYVNRSGEIRGSIHGVYGVSEHHLGVFRGQYFDADGTPLGVLAGRWTKAPDRPGGPLFGMWAGVEFGDEE